MLCLVHCSEGGDKRSYGVGLICCLGELGWALERAQSIVRVWESLNGTRRGMETITV